jgi:uncharacterized membrane protein SpoIIM required for sporulation
MKSFWYFFAVMAVLLAVSTALGTRFGPRSGHFAAAADGYRGKLYTNLSVMRNRPQARAMAFRHILGNNLRTDALMLVGAITCCLTGVVELTINGLKMGMLYSQVHQNGLPTTELWRYIAPHGIVEYSGYLTGQAAAMCFVRDASRWLLGGGDLDWLVLVPAVASLLLIVVAAWIEVYVTPFL